MRKYLFFGAAAASLASAASAQEWQYQGPNPYAEPDTYAFISTNGDPQFAQGSKISIIRSAVTEDAAWRGKCSFNNCSAYVVIDGAVPQDGELVTATFSSGEVVRWQAGTLNNYARVGMAATNIFVKHVRSDAHVDIAFGEHTRRFSLKGSARALDGLLPDIRVYKAPGS